MAEKARVFKRKVADRELTVAKQGAAIEAIGTLAKDVETYVMTYGQFSLIDTLEAILRSTGPARVDISTWTAANAHIERAASLLGGCSITSMRWMVDPSFIKRQPAYCRRLRDLFGDGCIRAFKSHAKFMTIRNDEWNVSVRTSMNLNGNPRLEYLEISNDSGLCDFLSSVIDSVFNECDEGLFDREEVVDLRALNNIELPGRATAAEIKGLAGATIG